MNKEKKEKYKITVLAEVESSLQKEDLESQLVLSLFDIEAEEKTSDGDNNKLEVTDYDLTEAILIK